MQYSTYTLILPYLLYKMSVEQAATLSFLELLVEVGSKAMVTHTLSFQGLLRDFNSKSPLKWRLQMLAKHPGPSDLKML